MSIGLEVVGKCVPVQCTYASKLTVLQLNNVHV